MRSTRPSEAESTASNVPRNSIIVVMQNMHLMKSREIVVSLSFGYKYFRCSSDNQILMIIILSKNILVNEIRTPRRTFCECDLKFSARIASVDTLDSNFDNSTCVTVESGEFFNYKCIVNLAD